MIQLEVTTVGKPPLLSSSRSLNAPPITSISGLTATKKRPPRMSSRRPITILPSKRRRPARNENNHSNQLGKDACGSGFQPDGSGGFQPRVPGQPQSISELLPTTNRGKDAVPCVPDFMKG